KHSEGLCPQLSYRECALLFSYSFILETESEPSPLKLGGSFTFLWDTSWTWERPSTCDAEVFVSVCVAVAFGGVALTDLLRVWCGGTDALRPCDTYVMALGRNPAPTD
ncbi:hypothetical protein ANANG_G00194130, partial [Anguilla anguilla]